MALEENQNTVPQETANNANNIANGTSSTQKPKSAEKQVCVND